ncbi:MAG: tetratricopeptide repeat protein [Rhodocyclales bacterium]|nr:tetratricopeptide repeat protein [Rhodocyclales bacterium]
MPSSLPTRLKTNPLAAVLVALALGLAAPVASADNLADIQKLIKSGQYPQALEKTDAYIASKPRDAQGRFMKGLILTEMNRPADAVAVFTKLTEDYPELPEPYNNLAVLYAQQKQYEKARTALEMAIRTHPAYAVAYENLGDVYAKLASQAYDKALQLDSSNAAAQGKLSLIRDLVSTNTRPGGKPATVAAATAAKPAEPVKPAAVEPAKPAAEPLKPAATVVPVAPAAVTPVKTAEAPKAAEKPVEKPAAPAKAADAGEAEAVNAVQGWAAAWSKKDVKGYLAHYAPDFQTPNGMPRKAWEAERQQRIEKPGKIQVSVDDVKVAIAGDKATVKFRQNYKSATLNSSAGKTLVLIRVGGKWLIQQERVG